MCDRFGTFLSHWLLHHCLVCYNALVAHHELTDKFELNINFLHPGIIHLVSAADHLTATQLLCVCAHT